MLAALLSQTMDPIAGGAGWASAGLFGLVLAWLLMIHLPAKDKQLKELLESRDKLMFDLIHQEKMSCDKRHQENIVEWRSDREQAERHHQAELAEHQRTHDELKETRHRVADVAQSQSVWIALVSQVLRLQGLLPEPDSSGAFGHKGGGK